MVGDGWSVMAVLRLSFPGESGQDFARARTARSMAGRTSSPGVDGEPMQEQTVRERHEGPGPRHGVGHELVTVPGLRP